MKSNPLNDPNMFRNLTRRIQENKNNINKMDEGTALDTNTVTSKLTSPMSVLKSNTQSAFTNPSTGSKTVFKLTKNNDMNNLNRSTRELSEKVLPKESLFESTIFNRLLLENRKFGEAPKKITSHKIDGIQDHKIFTDAKKHLGNKVNRLVSTGHQNRKLHSFIGDPNKPHKDLPKSWLTSLDGTKYN